MAYAKPFAPVILSRSLAKDPFRYVTTGRSPLSVFDNIGRNS